MIEPLSCFNEYERLRELNSYSILDSIREENYDNLVNLAASICQVPIAVITLVDRSRQWFKSCKGLEATETPRSISFCAHAINQPDSPLIVENAILDNRFYDNPLVVNAPNVRFYVGVPLITENGYPLGTLCVIDSKPRKISNENLASLQMLAKQVVNLLTLRKSQLNLKNQLEHNKILLKEVHHRVKNNLQVVSSLLRMQSNETSNLSAKEAFKSSQARIISIAKVHNLLYESENFSEVDLGVYVKKLSSRIIAAMGSNVDLNVDMDTIKLKLDVVVPLGLIINEIITNSMKHAFVGVDEPKINVFCKELEFSKYKLEISDNGIGMKRRETKHNNTLGTRLIQSLVRQFKGEIVLDYNKNGTHYIITF